jgi:serine/threonine protein kinase
MGEVCSGLDARLGRRVALKILPSQYTADACRLYRFQKEARAASGLNHPNIFVVREMGEQMAGTSLLRSSSRAAHSVSCSMKENWICRRFSTLPFR